MTVNRSAMFETAFSESEEVHSFSAGIGVGIIHGVGQTEETLGASIAFISSVLALKGAKSGKWEQFQSEPWYAIGGYAVGFVIGAAVRYFQPVGVVG